MLFPTTTFAVLGLATLAQSHMMMKNPVPFGKSTLDNSPLKKEGVDFPCKLRDGVYDAEGANNIMALGSSQSMSFVGGATHGGGSCQISITYDEKPTKSSVWKVIHSIEGGCPIRNVAGNNGALATSEDPDTYTYTIPTILPTGKAVLAWTWFNKVGNREMYMNCAPVTFTAASSKRDEENDFMDGNYTMLTERDTAAYNSLPDMFVANVNNGCATTEGDDLKFPDAGDSVEKNNNFVSGLTPSGACSTARAAAATAGTASSAQTTSAPAKSSAPAVAGGVFITVSPASSSPNMATAFPVASSATIATVAPVSSAAAASSDPVDSNSPVVSTPVASSSTPASTGTTGSGSAIAAGTACTTEGQWNCIGGTSYQRCASGTWSVVQQVAAGTTCTAGQSTNINIVAMEKPKREVRFSGAHVRRHMHKS